MSAIPAVAATTYGLPLAAPSQQTFLPVIDSRYGTVIGFFPIAKTTFAGSETSFALSQGSVPITTVTIQPFNKTNTQEDDVTRVTQFMAVRWSVPDATKLPWLGYVEFVSANSPEGIGYYGRWSNPQVYPHKRYILGAFLNGMKTGYDTSLPAASAPVPPDVTTPDATLTWQATLPQLAFSEDCPFIDFNWVDLFQAQSSSLATGMPGQVVPLTLTVVENPTGEVFKAAVVQGVAGSAGPVIVPGGGVQYNTVRIMQIADTAPPDDYVFEFSIGYVINGTATGGGAIAPAYESVPVKLTMTVPKNLSF